MVTLPDGIDFILSEGCEGFVRKGLSLKVLKARLSVLLSMLCAFQYGISPLIATTVL